MTLVGFSLGALVIAGTSAAAAGAFAIGVRIANDHVDGQLRTASLLLDSPLRARSDIPGDQDPGQPHRLRFQFRGGEYELVISFNPV